MQHRLPFAPFALTGLLALAGAGQALELSSPELKPGQRLSSKQVFNGFGCQGENQSPALAWRDAPAGTQSFALTVYDPDAPTGSGWWHWLVVNLPATSTGLPAGVGPLAALPKGAVEVRNDYGNPGFGGACPPVGDAPHRYQFTLWALKTPTLNLPANASAALTGYLIRANALGSTQLEVKYGR